MLFHIQLQVTFPVVQLATQTWRAIHGSILIFSFVPSLGPYLCPIGNFAANLITIDSRVTRPV